MGNLIDYVDTIIRILGQRLEESITSESLFESLTGFAEELDSLSDIDEVLKELLKEYSIEAILRLEAINNLSKRQFLTIFENNLTPMLENIQASVNRLGCP